MKGLSYRRPGLFLRMGVAAAEQQIRDLQRDLRQLGYLKNGIDGRFGPGTKLAVKSLEYDLLENQGIGSDGPAPVRVVDYNRGRVSVVSGEVNQALAACIGDMLEDNKFPKLPRSDNPVQENQRITQQVGRLQSKTAPIPFLMAIFQQESGLKHFIEPSGRDEDSFVSIGLDRNKGQQHIVTSRGYGLGQYTLFHHPPRLEEVTGFIQNAAGNIQKAARELRESRDRLSDWDLQVGNFYLSIRNVAGAVSRYRGILATDPEYTRKDSLYFHLAEALEKSDNKAEALPYYERLLTEYEQSEYLEEAKKRIERLRQELAAVAPAER
jgi:tetratricopeptide (TPR) repeat protein